MVEADLTEEQIERILEEAEHALGSHVTRDGEGVFDSPTHIITGTKA